MWVQVLDSGCSAGFPAWNEGSEAAGRARANDPSMPIREAAALAVSADGERCSIFEAPLHLPSTLARAARFAPRTGTRATPIDAFVLTCADPLASAGARGLASALSVRILSPIGIRDFADAGHAPIDGHEGSLVSLSGVRGDSYYVHLAGANPACDEKSPESERIRTACVEIAVDGQEFEL